MCLSVQLDIYEVAFHNTHISVIPTIRMLKLKDTYHINVSKINRVLYSKQDLLLEVL